MREIQNAKITGTMLGDEDHGIFTAFVNLSGAGWGQGFGGYDLRDCNRAAQFIKCVCHVVGVERWEDLPGKLVRVDHDTIRIHRIGHITDGLWFDPQSMFEVEP